MQEHEAKAQWKKISELNYNLFSQYMDNQDPWKQAIGADLYKEKAH